MKRRKTTIQAHKPTDRIAPFPVKIVQDKLDPVPLEVLAKTIVAISDGVEKLRDSGIKEETLHLLIQHAAPSKHRRAGSRLGAPIPLKTIKAVLEGLADLRAVHLQDWHGGDDKRRVGG